MNHNHNKTKLNKKTPFILIPFIILKNFFFLLKYPFMAVHNSWSGRRLSSLHTMYEDIPAGWRFAFGRKFLTELRTAWIASSRPRNFYFVSIKTKDGKLEMYYAGATQSLRTIITKYRHLSQYYCEICGDFSEYLTNDTHPAYLCESCYFDYLAKKKGPTFASDEEFLKHLETAKISYSEDYPEEGDNK